MTVDKIFTVHLLNEEGKDKSRHIAAYFQQLLDHLQNICPEGREMAIVKTKLEEAWFFAKKSMANQLENQQ